MRMLWAVTGVLVISLYAIGESPVQPPVACAKTISFAIAEGGQPVPAIPRWAIKWIGKKYHVEGHPELCLSQTPSSTTVNYLVIFSTSESSFEGLAPSAQTYTSTGPLSGNVAGVSGYGGTWNYSYTGVLPAATTSSIDLLRVDASKKALVIRAYNQQGRQVAHYNVDGDHSRQKLMEQVIADIHSDAVEPSTQKRIAAPLSVYYVNCDVDSPTPSSLVASAKPSVSQPEPVQTPPPPQPAILDFSSNPAGADIYLDGGYVGKTPFSLTVPPGEHVVMMRAGLRHLAENDPPLLVSAR